MSGRIAVLLVLLAWTACSQAPAPAGHWEGTNSPPLTVCIVNGTVAMGPIRGAAGGQRTWSQVESGARQCRTVRGDGPIRLSAETIAGGMRFADVLLISERTGCYEWRVGPGPGGSSVLPCGHISK